MPVRTTPKALPQTPPKFTPWDISSDPIGRTGYVVLCKRKETIVFEVPDDCEIEPYVEDESEGWVEGGMHGTDQEPELARAVACLKAKELALVFGHVVPYGWPV